MAEEALSPAQQLALASNFVLNSPPAQVGQIIDGVHRRARRPHPTVVSALVMYLTVPWQMCAR